MACYGAPVKAALTGRAWWNVDLWERSHVALDQDMLCGKVFLEKLSVHKVDQEGASHGSTRSKGLQIEDKAIKSAARNALVISVLTLRQVEHKRCVNVICAVAQPLSEFHSAQNKDFCCFFVGGAATDNEPAL